MVENHLIWVADGGIAPLVASNGGKVPTTIRKVEDVEMNDPTFDCRIWMSESIVH